MIDQQDQADLAEIKAKAEKKTENNLLYRTLQQQQMVVFHLF